MDNKRFTICFKDGTLFTFSASSYLYEFDKDCHMYMCKFLRYDDTYAFTCDACSVRYVLEKPITVAQVQGGFDSRRRFPAIAVKSKRKRGTNYD